MASKHPVVHFEMPYGDQRRVSEFYEKAFGWKMQQMGAAMGNYVVATTTDTDEHRMVKTPGTINGGFFSKNSPGVTAIPSVVISVDDIQAAMKQVTDAGGKIVGDVTDIPGVGLWVAFEDTEANRVSLLQPKGM